MENFRSIHALLLGIILSIRIDAYVHNQTYSWTRKSDYYFSDLRHKLEEIFANSPHGVTGCQTKTAILPDKTMELPANVKGEMFASSFPVSDEIYQWWTNMSPATSWRVDPYLCEVVYLKSKPIFKAKQCQLPFMMHPSAPRCQISYLKWICDEARTEINDTRRNSFILPEADHKTQAPPVPYLVIAKNSFVSMCGQVSAKCGVVHTTANCRATGFKGKAKHFGKECGSDVIDRVEATPHVPGANFTCKDKGNPAFDSSEVTYYPKVFVVAEVDDTHVYHIHLEIVPRIVYHLDFLLANPGVKILIGCDTEKKKTATSQGLNQGLRAITPFMRLLGLSMDRLVVHRNVYSDIAYLPMEGGCQDPIYNTWQILTMRRLFMSKLGLDGLSSYTIGSRPGLSLSQLQQKNHWQQLPPSTKATPLMVLIRRSSRSKHTRNRFDLARQWSDEFQSQLLNELQEEFPRYRVKEFSDKNTTLMESVENQILAVTNADILIGVHGAGLSNMIYMKPNSVVVELAPYGNDGRCLMGGGPFSRCAALLSHNYLMHIPPTSEFSFQVREKTSEINSTRFISHIKAYLTSIGRA